MKKLLVAVIAMALLLIGCDAGNAEEKQSLPTRASTSKDILRIMLSDFGSRDKVSRDFTVSGGCSNGVITASGTAGDDNPGTGVWINVRIFDITIADYAVENTGVMNLPASQRVSLPAGTYYATVDSGQFVDKWQYTIKCR